MGGSSIALGGDHSGRQVSRFSWGLLVATLGFGRLCDSHGAYA